MSLEEAVAQLEKQFGTGTVMRLGDDAAPMEVIPTGSLALDRALGVGGLPRGRIVEIFGPESSGKSTLALHAVANAQKVGAAAYVDTEHSLDPKYARALGVDVDNLLMAQPDHAEQALEVAHALIKSGELSIIVIDSVAAMVPRAELEGDFGDANVGLHARIMSQAMRKLTGVIEKTNTLALFINQIRHKIGIVYGSPEVTTGGGALKFYSSVRMDVRRIETEKQGDEATGSRTRVKIVKNKVAPPFRIAEFSILYGEGISRERELLDVGVEYEVVQKSGNWFSFDGKKLGQGKENARQALSEDQETASLIEAKIREAME